jgi:hypothetical protein
MLLCTSRTNLGRDEVYLRMLAGNEAPVQLSTHGGTKPLWAPDGRDVYYLSPSGAVMAVGVTSVGAAKGEPRMLFQADPLAYLAVAPDGDLLVQYAPDNRVYPNLTVIVNWQQLLKSTTKE